MSVRVRIAPSPTGVPHIGTTRTALFNYLFAKHNKGKFILRIEDTDRERLVPASLPQIYKILEVLGLTPDEGPRAGGLHGPYIQSERLATYQEFAKQLVDTGFAYFCFCDKSRLAKIRSELQKKGLPPKYDRHCLTLSKTEINKKIIEKLPHVIRLKIPAGVTWWNDLIHGEISFKNELLDDQILLKSDGWPTYHLAVVVDDYLMKITHILRGDEWISSTPKHLILYKFFGWKVPRFGHLPLILGPDKTKLSKRHGAKSILEYIEDGFLPEALINFMALLGWSPKTNQEIFSLEELRKNFDLKGINPTSPVFNLEKLKWFNGQWIRRLQDEELVKRLDKFIPKNWDKKLVKKVLPLVKERVVTLADFVNWTNFFFEEVEVNWKDVKKDLTKEVLTKIGKSFQRIIKWKTDLLEKTAREVIGETKPKDAFHILRLAITGKAAGPPLFESLEILGREKVLRRIAKAIKIAS